MIRFIKELYEARVERIRAERVGFVELNKALTEASNIVSETPDAEGWMKMSGNWKKGSNQYADHQTMIKEARKFFRLDPNGRGALMTIVKYVIGRGIRITPKSKNPKIAALWKEFWESKRNNMQLRQIEIVRRAFRDGNCLIQFYNKDENGASTWKTTIRFRDPLDLSPQSKDAPLGILQNKEDPEKIEKYFFKNPDGTNQDVPVDPKDIVHIKPYVDLDQPVGDSYILAVMEMFTHYKQWMKYRIILNKVRTAVVMVRKIMGSTVDVNRIAQTIKSSATAKSGESKKQMLQAGTILNANPGVEYDFKSPNINAGDVSEDGRRMKLEMCAGTGLPEFALGDASNANYASTLIAEGPFVKEVQYWQAFFEGYFKEIYRRVVQAAVDAGKLTAPSEADIWGVTDLSEAKSEKETTDSLFGCDIQWPEIVHRDLPTTVAAIGKARDYGWISDPTASALMGMDIEEEIRKQQQLDTIEDNPFRKESEPDPEEVEGVEAMKQEMKKTMAEEN